MKTPYTTLALALLFLGTASGFGSCAKKEAHEPLLTKDTLAVAPTAVKAINLLVAPGKGIGNVLLEQPSDSLAYLGPADLSDAAMGKSWQTWYSKVDTSATGKSELNVYTEYQDRELKRKVVRQIRITSPDFKTAEGVSTGKPLMEVVEDYPNLKWVGRFKDPKTGNTVAVFDDAPSGIAFEIEHRPDAKVCTAIVVHPKNQEVTKSYLYFHPDLTTTEE